MALDPGLARQALGRPLSDAEVTLAQDLESVFAAGTHDFAAVAAALEAKGTPRPSGARDSWTADTLANELAAINAALDAAYAADGVGA
jgi:hypothetical protein